MSQLNLEPTGQFQPRTADYVPITEDAESVVINFTEVRGNGYAQVWLRSGGLVRRIDTVSLFDVAELSYPLFYPLEAGQELGLSLISYGADDVLFRATVTISGPVADGGGETPSGSVLELIGRVATLEEQVAALSGDDENGNLSVAGRVTAVESSVANVRADLSATKDTVASQGATITNNYNSLNSRVTTLEGSTGSGSTSAISNVIQKFTLSAGGNPLTLDANAYDRVDIIGDRTNTISVTNIEHATDERNLIVAALTTVRGTTRAYTGVDVWNSPGGAPPETEQRPGFGEMLYFTNIHGATFGAVRSGVQYKYHAKSSGLIANYPMVTGTGDREKSLVGANRVGILMGVPEWRNTGGVVLGPDRYFVDTNGISTVQAIQVWFSLGSLVTTEFQRIFTVTEGGTGNFLAYALNQTPTGWDFEYRGLNGTLHVPVTGTPAANVLYCVTIRGNFGATPTASVIITEGATHTETAITSFGDFVNRMTGTSEFRVGAVGGSSTRFLTAGSIFRGALLYNAQLSSTDARANIGRYL